MKRVLLNLVQYIFVSVHVSAQNLTIWDVYQDFRASVEKWTEIGLENENINQQTIENFYNHGCWCSKLKPNSRPIKTGGEPISKVDRLCRDWLRTRFCNDKLTGGSCHDSNNNDPNFSTFNNFYYQIQSSDGSAANMICNTVNQNTGRILESCEIDSCKIDKFYALNIFSEVLLDPTLFDNDDDVNQVDEFICQKTGMDNEPYECVGEAPHLSILTRAAAIIELESITTTEMPPSEARYCDNSDDSIIYYLSECNTGDESSDMSMTI